MQIPSDVAAVRHLIWSRIAVAQACAVVRADPRQLSNFGLYVVPDNRIVPQSGLKDHGWRALTSAVKMHFVTADIYESPRWRLALFSGTFDCFISCADCCQEEDERRESTNRVAQVAKSSIGQPKNLWKHKKNDDQTTKDIKGINHQTPERHWKPLSQGLSLGSVGPVPQSLWRQSKYTIIAAD